LGRGRDGNRKLWKYILKQNGKKSTSNNFNLDNCGNPNKVIADKFAECFNKNYCNTKTNNMLPRMNNTNHLINSIIVTVDQVRNGLKSLRSNTLPGPDNISARVLNVCFAEIAPSLTSLFNLSLNSGI
jgi:hypothetical protein